MTSRSDPLWDLAEHMQRQAELLARLLSRPAAPVAYSRGWSPRADVYTQGDEEAVVVFELPGVDASTLEVYADPRKGLALAGSRPSVAPASLCLGGSPLSVEIPTGPFLRHVALPFTVDPARATAEYADGLLTVRLPRAASPTGPTKVPLNKTPGRL